MVLLVVFGGIWLGMRMVAAFRTMGRVPDEQGVLQDAEGGGRGLFFATEGLQDAPCGLQDAVHPDRVAVGSAAQARVVPAWSLILTLTAGAAWYATRGVRDRGFRRGLPLTEVTVDDLSVATGEPAPEWVSAFRQRILDTVPRPQVGPVCFGGRDDTAYLRGWDDAVDWISQGHDAKAPSWSDVAHMTGWNDAVHEISQVRRSAARRHAAELSDVSRAQIRLTS